MAKKRQRKLNRPPPELQKAKALPQKERCASRNIHRAGYRKNEFGAGYAREMATGKYREALKIATRRHGQPRESFRFATMIWRAIDSRQRLRVLYQDRLGNETCRTIRPTEWAKDRGDHFFAHCELRGEERCFRVSRIVDAWVTEQ